MFLVLRSHVARRQPARLVHARRWLATETIMPATEGGQDEEQLQRQRYERFLEQKALEPPERPQAKVTVNEKHGLYAFFRQTSKDGELPVIYETIEASNKPETKTGRSWNAVELRRKSFKDLHTLWYIILRERNLLATQKAEAKKLGIQDQYTEVKEKDARCRKTMARIKQVLNERRLAYEQAYALDYELYQTASKEMESKEMEKGMFTEGEKSPASVESGAPSTRGRRRPTVIRRL
ncbi:hypothetical protein EW145_g1292 [Phellinidium pouzarii]|uniref:Large ribosomal subunit protein uL29m n=1 Tax=Phellinidium pouzarii TaxID=167371 RepID=A0A4S4LFM6_9AGAM|nr:hypothetical protein EW145_g1292 [Phellinidium pouzarii]